MFKHFFVRLFVLCYFLLFVGCAATFMRGTSQIVQFNINPPGSTIEIEGQEYTSPASVELDRNGSYRVELKREGYATQTIMIRKKVSGGWVFWGLVTGWIIVDLITGAIYELSPDSVTVSLESLTGKSSLDISVMLSKNGEGIIVDSPQPVHMKIEQAE